MACPQQWIPYFVKNCREYKLEGCPTPERPPDCPLERIRPRRGCMTWLCDRAHPLKQVPTRSSIPNTGLDGYTLPSTTQGDSNLPLALGLSLGLVGLVVVIVVMAICLCRRFPWLPMMFTWDVGRHNFGNWTRPSSTRPEDQSRYELNPNLFEQLRRNRRNRRSRSMGEEESDGEDNPGEGTGEGAMEAGIRDRSLTVTNGGTRITAEVEVHTPPRGTVLPSCLKKKRQAPQPPKGLSITSTAMHFRGYATSTPGLSPNSSFDSSINLASSSRRNFGGRKKSFFVPSKLNFRRSLDDLTQHQFDDGAEFGKMGAANNLRSSPDTLQGWIDEFGIQSGIDCPSLTGVLDRR